MVFVWLTLRGVPFADVWDAMRRARWGVLLGISIPSYVLVVYLRALRWRHLTDPIQPMRVGALFRALSVGFMANNVFPLRMGEVIRAWYLARETGASAASILGTILLERVIDVVTLVLLAGLLLAAWSGADDPELGRRALLLLPVAFVPLVGLWLLRAAPNQAMRLLGFVLRPLPERISEGAQRLLERFAAGLGALRGGGHLAWIALHSLNMWLVASTLPFLAAFWAMGIRFDSVGEELAAAWTTLVAVGIAVAIPSAPGFFGPYHWACKKVLVGLGVAPETAVALGTLAHAIFWVTLTLLGLAVLRYRSASLRGVREASESADPSATGKDPAEHNR